ncbi:efflux RND transporter periplasmic adaptor subunit [Pontiella sulfatireligans]|uniref:Multidrug resistance protein MexA n=1 Tax=Pontiella sulfatireligans TaxID=2750658 RepID=A0A6C2UWH0_9BACT|nr:efflux RND transporter periplasmic adaptor subunit [Pontiella sulfatireligans]VGO23457.1 Multidrug resistance protein MexA [Pontiella sulfatireligans]
MKRIALSLICLLAVLSGCSQSVEPPERPPRPVSYVTLKTTTPESARRFSGTVDAWKSAQVGFEVAGRVEWVIDMGTEVAGETRDISGKSVAAGTVIARLDDERYRIALKDAEAKLEASRAHLILQQQELERYTRMVAERSASREKLDQVEASCKQAQSEVHVAEGNVENARLNLRDCTLVAPFSGQIARIHVTTGTFAVRAQPVVTVQMIDPVKVQFAVASQVDADIDYNEAMMVHVPGTGESLYGEVYLKDTAADAATRTFLITVLTRNKSIIEGAAVRNEAQASGLFRLEKRSFNDSGPWFAENECLHEDEFGFYVWAAKGLPGKAGRVTARKVRVVPGNELLDFIQIFTYRELKNFGDLNPETDLLLRRVTGEVKDGDEVVLTRKRWMLRPGDVVQVSRGVSDGVPGIYVPEEAIQFDGRKHFVFLAVDQGDNTATASRVDVLPGATAGALQQISPLADGRLSEGMRLVVEGAYYVADGEKINPVESEGPSS